MSEQLNLMVQFAISLILAGALGLGIKCVKKKNKPTVSDDKDAHWI